MRLLAVLLFALTLFAPATALDDPHSFAEPDQAVARHLSLEAGVDFRTRRLKAVATWDLEVAPGAERVVFDTSGLEITRITDGSRPLKWELGPEDPVLGRPLAIQLPEGATRVRIEYLTDPAAKALQWLEPEQTAGGQHPFLFTQSQAILARSWLPCQDSPAVRFTYQARLTVPQGLMAVMSAENPQQVRPDGVYELSMPQPVPAYLMALAVGDLRFAPLGERTGVYAEPEVLPAAAAEFAETEKMLEVAEELYGPYRWGRYDLLVLPPSFPFGGMENPRLTFVTPTIIAGDRSLTSLVAHELAHSWSGNLVTNATWDDFWLNEGFTVYFERRIMEAMYGPEYADMLAVLGYGDLEHTLEDPDLPQADTHLKLNLRGRDPDLGVSDIAYEKGYLFLVELERAVGRERFDRFLRNYFDEHAFGTMTTEAFLEELEELKPGVETERWVYSPGLPAGYTGPSSDRFTRVDRQLAAWAGGARASQLNTEGWSSHEWLHFLRHLPENVTGEQLAQLDQAFNFTGSGNSEILFQWLLTAIRQDWEPAYPALERFLVEVGRRKFLAPLYRELAQEPDSLEWAREIYRRARTNYHGVSRGTVEEILEY